MMGDLVLVRTYSAGVHIGVLHSWEGKIVTLNRARRLWKWSGAFTLSEVSVNGINPKLSRMSIEVPIIILTEAIEILPVSDIAAKTFDACHE